MCTAEGTTPLRIAHVINEPFGAESASGVQQAVYCLARTQAQMGEAVAVFSRDDDEVYVLEQRAEQTAGRSTPALSGYGRSLRERILARYFEPQRSSDVLAWRPSIVHFHSVHIPQNVALAAHLRRAGIPYCVTVHGAVFRAALQRGRLKKALFHLLFERQYLNDAHFIQALSPREADAIRRYGVNPPIVVVPNALPPENGGEPSTPDARPGGYPWRRERRVFMFIGRLDVWQKGLDLLIDAFARSGVRDAALVIVGPDWLGSQSALRQRAERLGIRSRVVFTGPAFGAERERLLAAADVFVHPSRWEGLSFSVLAAAAAAKPCVITNEADPLGELERANAAILVRPAVASIEDGLVRAAALDAGELRIMGARAQQVAATGFTWPSIAGRLLDAYRTATG